MAQQHPAEPRDPRTSNRRPPFEEPSQDVPAREEKMHVKPDFGETSYQGHGRLTDRIALITGADSGIGRAVALAFAREGADVAIAYWNEHEDASETKRLVESAGRRGLMLPGDLADRAHCSNLVEDTVAAFGRIDVLVNNASYQDKAVENLEELEPDRIERAFRVNVLAMFYLVRTAVPYMRAGSTIVNVASIQAYQPSPAILDYASTKGAIVTFTKGLAQSLITKGIRANCVAPGPVWTPLIAQSFTGDKVAGFGSESPMQRPAQPAELAPAFVFLACDESRYVNGEVLGVTGGKPLA